MPLRNQTINLSDGRRLGYDERGSSDGKPLFYFHGSPSSRVECSLFIDEELLRTLNVRLIAVDRPGMGLSDFQSHRRIEDWPQDVLELADHLGIEKFSILAYSLGGPYGFICAYAIPQRLKKVGIVSGAALFTKPELMTNINKSTRNYLTMPREKPWLSHLFLGMMLVILPRVAPRKFIDGAASVLPESDKLLVSTNLNFQNGFLDMVHEAIKQGTRGAFLESQLTVTDWGFRLEDIQMPVLLWHGETDANIPVEMARYAAAAIPKCEAKFIPNEGHLTLFKKYAEEIISNLVK